jgi:hypothetical protein
MNQDTEQFKQVISRIHLDTAEKAQLASEMKAFLDTHSPIRSRWHFPVFTLKTTFALFAIILIMGSTSTIAEQANPGDPLYWVKTDVNERIVHVLSFTDEAKAKSQISFANKRFEEINALLKNTTSDKEDISEAITHLNEHSEYVEEYIEKNTKEGDVAESFDTAIDFSAIINANEQLIGQIIVINTEEQASLKELDTVIEKHKAGVGPALAAGTTIKDTKVSDDDIQDVQDSIKDLLEYTEQDLAETEPTKISIKNSIESAEQSLSKGKRAEAFLIYKNVEALLLQHKINIDVSEYLDEPEEPIDTPPTFDKPVDSPALQQNNFEQENL